MSESVRGRPDLGWIGARFACCTHMVTAWRISGRPEQNGSALGTWKGWQTSPSAAPSGRRCSQLLTDQKHTAGEGLGALLVQSSTRTYLCLQLFTWLRLRALSGEAAFSSQFLALGTMHVRTPKASTYQFDCYVFIGVEIFACEERKKSFSCTRDNSEECHWLQRSGLSQLPSQIQIHASNTAQVSKPGQVLPFIQHKVAVFYGSTSVRCI